MPPASGGTTTHNQRRVRSLERRLVRAMLARTHPGVVTCNSYVGSLLEPHPLWIIDVLDGLRLWASKHDFELQSAARE